MASENKKIQLVVIGAGPGGYAAAFHAADLGLEVTLIDPKENPGGVCLYHGCIPTKTLLHYSEVVEEIRNAKQFGLEYKDVSTNLDKLRDFKQGVVEKLTRGLGHLTKRRKINYIKGTARFTASHELEVQTKEGKNTLRFQNAIIATGARSRPLPGIEFDHEKILSSRSALELTDVPGELLVVGAGYIGLEMGVIFHSLGSKVTIIEATSGILPGMDNDLAEVFQKERRDLLKGAKFDSKVLEAKTKDGSLNVTYEGKDGKKDSISCDKMLVAIGMVPNTEEIGLENIGINPGKGGFIEVNEFRQTSQKHIYAIGDITGEPLLAHKASHEGRVAAQHIAGQKTAFEPKVIPAVVYVGLAWVGLTEKEARERDIEIKVTRFPWSASGRASSMGIKHGLTKLISDPKSGRLLGAAFAGKHAEHLVAEATLAIEMGAVAKDLELTIHPHPTISETIMEAAELFSGHATHI
jgi:dihydrolipoamide dehydrogenase